MPSVAVIGGGPGGLMAAEVLSGAGLTVTVYERKPALGRKFLLAGRGGLNITHSEEFESFMRRYGAAAEKLRPAVEKFSSADLRAWCEKLGEPTFVGSSGRIFPKSFKASPLLRAWRQRLDKQGVSFVFNKQWTGWDSEGALTFADGGTAAPDAVVLALGGASWPRLGADGSWVEILQREKISVTPLRAANCGFTVAWSENFRSRFAGQPLKPAVFSFGGETVQGEAMIDARGVEGGAIYALSSRLRGSIEKTGAAELKIDLRPGLSLESLTQKLSEPRAALSFSNFLKKKGGLSALAAALLREADRDAASRPPAALAALIKNLPLLLDAPFSLERAISTAGGVALDAVDEGYMLRQKPGVFVVGEMLDWEAPTGGYLLQATFSTAVCAATNVIKRLQ